MNESKRSSIKEENKEEIKTNITNRNKLNIKGTLKVDKVHYLMKDEGQKLFEDINLQYMEPLEGGEESEEQDDGTYRKFLNSIKEDLNLKKENIVFVHDLGLNNNKLNVNDLFDKIKKKSRFKNRNSFLSVYRPKKEDIIRDTYVKKPKKIIPKRRIWGFKAIKSLFVSKIQLKQYLKSGKRILTYDNRKNVNNYFKIKHTLLNIRERKNAVRRNNSQKIFKKLKKGQISDNSDDNIFSFKKKGKINDSLSLLDSSKKTSKISEQKKKKEEEEKKLKEEEKQEVKKDETDENIKKLSPKNQKKKRNILKQKKKIAKKKKNYFLNKNSIFKRKGANPISVSRYNMNNNEKKFKSPAINSILLDIKELSQSILTNRIKKHNDKKNRTILYDKHFGYEYWKENEMRKYLCHNSTTNRNSKSFRALYNPYKDWNTFSVFPSSFSPLYNQRNGDDILDYETDFTSGINEKSTNPYSINWAKNIIQNSYNRKIKLKNNFPGVPKIELVRVNSSIFSPNREKITIDKSKNASEIFRKTNMFGRIYKNNELEFPIIKNF